MTKKVWLLALCVLLTGCPKLQAQPTMEITWTNFVAGGVRVFIYAIHNTSFPSPTNNMAYVSLPVGIDAGLFYAWPNLSPFDWTILYGGGTAYFYNTNTPIAPGGTLEIEVRTQSVLTNSGYIMAQAQGPATFTPVKVVAPTGPYRHPKLTNLTLSNATLTLTAQDLQFPFSYTLEHSTLVSGWTEVLTFWSLTNNAQTVSTPAPTNGTAHFYRLRSP